MGSHAKGFSSIADEADESLGPAMRALTLAQRRFVVAALTFPEGKDWQIAKAAGYSDRSHGALRVTAHRLFHDEKVISALHEEASKRLRSSAHLGVSVLAKIARTDGHRDQRRAAEAILNRTGFHEKTEHVMQVNHSDGTGRAMVARIEALAARLGMDAGALLGANAAAPMRLIEGKVEDDVVRAGSGDAAALDAQKSDHQRAGGG